MIKIAYMMSRFPKITETFILYEILQQAEFGIPVEVYPLLRHHEPVKHPEAAELVKRAHYQPFLSLPILRANWRWLRKQPRTYLKMIAEVLKGTLGSMNFFVGALCILPKTVYFAEQMQLEGVTHVHAHFANHPALAALIIHRLTGIPFSFTAHAHDIQVDRRMLDVKVANAKFVATISRCNQELIERCCGEAACGKVHIIHCGVTPGVFARGARKEQRSPFCIVSVGALKEYKGHSHLLAACKLLHERGLNFECHLLGEGPLRGRLQQQIDNFGLSRMVHLEGATPRPEVAEWLRRANVMALTSVPTANGKQEGIPVALMEAMAMELPVVSSAISGIPELVEDGVSGFLTLPGDPVAIADALQRLADDVTLAERMGAAGRAKVLAEFDQRQNAAHLAVLFGATGEKINAALTPEVELISSDPEPMVMQAR